MTLSDEATSEFLTAQIEALAKLARRGHASLDWTALGIITAQEANLHVEPPAPTQLKIAI